MYAIIPCYFMYDFASSTPSVVGGVVGGAAGVILLVAVVAAVVVIISRCLILQGLSVILMFILYTSS